MAVVWLVDDDPAVLRGVQRLLHAEGFETRAYADADTFLQAHDVALPGCAVIDIGLPGLDGLGLQERLAERDRGCPVIFLTGQGTIAGTVQAMRGGAVDVLTKPVEAGHLLAAVRRALACDDAARARVAADAPLRDRLDSLTPREREVLAQVVAGQLNKQIANRLGAAEKTIKVHRARVMQKMGVRSVAELVTLCNRIGADGGA